MYVPREHNANRSLSPLAPFDREPSAITIRLIPYRPGDAWRLEHPYITEQFGPFLTPFLANHRQLERLGHIPQPPSVVAQQLGTQTHRLYSAVATLAATGVIDLHRDGDHLTIVTSGAAPSTRRTIEQHPAFAATIDRYDPHRLSLPDIADRHEDYAVFRLGRLPQEHWALDSRWSRGVWGHYLGPNTNRLLGHLTAALAQPDQPLNIRGTATTLQITPVRLHAELDHLHDHAVIDLDHHHGAIATSGYVAAPPQRILESNPTIAASHRCLARQTRSLQPANRGLDR